MVILYYNQNFIFLFMKVLHFALYYGNMDIDIFVKV